MASIAARSISEARLVDSVVVGGGPAGLAAIGSLLEHRPQHRQLWVDRLFQAGRVGTSYRQVPSNTKAGLFVDFATAVAPFRQIVEAAEEPNPFTALQQLQQDQGCELKYAADLCLMLSKGVPRHFQNVEQRRAKVTSAILNKQTRQWTVALDGKGYTKTSKLVLCTGSSPISQPQLMTGGLPENLVTVHLNAALRPSSLGWRIPSDATVAVVGASHSAVLVLMNLYKLATTSHPNLRIKWFTRHNDLRYAEYKDGWILYDNTGLKGEAAQWARNNLEERLFRNSPVKKVITKILTPPEEEQAVYASELPSCTHLIQAIGFQRNPLPDLGVVEKAGAETQPLSVYHDASNGRFSAQPVEASAQGRTYIPGLFGAGIAFPERVVDPVGNVEDAVGFWKFMKFLKKSVPEWIESSK
ncbi:hypothetical protein K4K61_006531 [Colletotrichum sp. SAR11_59]|uniref:FAD/NAD(P)-binding domain-containing protein n=1 Tax=Colletotrichum asianum TaxID=702518 RepID=A0A8H3ZME3_9PEZI|nr:hypothetical protein GQ607_011956 [Colletotrichum asianum]KAI8304022.1 hypothetical protein K4K61_006531 [Colletotrichum sp. SAR11_59]